jgi:hypothetical protein
MELEEKNGFYLTLSYLSVHLRFEHRVKTIYEVS